MKKTIEEITEKSNVFIAGFIIGGITGILVLSLIQNGYLNW